MLSRDDVGRVVRETWEAWAREQPDVAEHPSWLVPWESLPERDREVDMRIGDAVTMASFSRLRADVERLTRELREARAAIRAYTPRCFVCSRSGTKAWAGQRHRYCDAHADTGHSDVECAPAIRTAEKDGDE